MSPGQLTSKQMKKVIILFFLISFKAFSQDDWNNQLHIFQSIDASVLYGPRVNMGVGMKHSIVNVSLYGNNHVWKRHNEFGMRLGFEVMRSNWLSIQLEAHGNKQTYRTNSGNIKSSYHGRGGMKFQYNNSEKHSFYIMPMIDNILPYVEFGVQFNLKKL